MTEQDPSNVSKLLRRAREDPAVALQELAPLVLAELRRIATAQLAHERKNHTLQPTALVHEAYLRLADHVRIAWQDRAQFLGVAAHVMRQVLVDHARTRGARKRGGDLERVTLDERSAGDAEFTVDLLDLHEKLETLRATQERRARVVELRFFGGLTYEEAGHVLGLSPKTVKADWYVARAWLRRELRSNRESDGD